MSQAQNGAGQQNSASATPLAGGAGGSGADPPPPTEDSTDSGETDENSVKFLGDSKNSVASIVVGRRDFAGRKITEVYAKFSDFAIYLGDREVHVQFSDDPVRASAQSELIAPLQPSRQKLEYLVSDEKPGKGGLMDGGHRRQIATALRFGLRDQPVLANAVLEDAIRNATEERLRRSRISFIPAATLMALPIAALLFLATLLGSDRDVPFAMGGGALGAYLSMAIGIRTRVLSPENSVRANYVDSGLRVAIGILSGAALILLVTSGLVNIQAVSNSTSSTIDKLSNWRLAVILGFAAGFLERLLPDLLSKSFPNSSDATGQNAPNPNFKKAAAELQAERASRNAVGPAPLIDAANQ